MYLYWSYSQCKIYASVNNILKIVNFKKVTFWTFWLTYMSKIVTPTLICYCVHDNILQASLVSTHSIFSCQLPNELRSPWTYFWYLYSKCFVTCNGYLHLWGHLQIKPQKRAKDGTSFYGVIGNTPSRFLAHLVMNLCNHALSVVWCCHHHLCHHCPCCQCHRLCTAVSVKPLIIEILYLTNICIYIPSICT